MRRQDRPQGTVQSIQATPAWHLCAPPNTVACLTGSPVEMVVSTTQDPDQTRPEGEHITTLSHENAQLHHNGQVRRAQTGPHYHIVHLGVLGCEIDLDLNLLIESRVAHLIPSVIVIVNSQVDVPVVRGASVSVGGRGACFFLVSRETSFGREGRRSGSGTGAGACRSSSDGRRVQRSM